MLRYKENKKFIITGRSDHYDPMEKNNLKYVTVTNKDENGNVLSKEEKDYPKVGNYEINFFFCIFNDLI